MRGGDVVSRMDSSNVSVKDPVVAEGLSKTFDGVEALRGLSFRVGEGEIFGLLGPNGAGKTTALHILMGIIEPSRGSVSVLGLSPFSEPYEVRSRINFCSAYVQLPFNLSVRRNLDIFARLYGVADPAGRVQELLETFEIAGLAAKPAGSLSSGQQTRLNLAKCLLNEPEVLFLDEPTASLDPDMAHFVRDVLKRLRQERRMTIVYTSHNMAEVEALCDRVLFIDKGRKVVEGTPEEVRRHFGEDSLERVFLRLARGERGKG